MMDRQFLKCHKNVELKISIHSNAANDMQLAITRLDDMPDLICNRK